MRRLILLIILGIGCSTEDGRYEKMVLSVSADEGLDVSYLDVIGVKVDGGKRIIDPRDPEKHYRFEVDGWDLIKKPYRIGLTGGEEIKGLITVIVFGMDKGKNIIGRGVVEVDLGGKGEVGMRLKGIKGMCDKDGDGFDDCNIEGCCLDDFSMKYGMKDCNDNDDGSNPLIYEDGCWKCGDGKDNDCDGSDVECNDKDGDGVKECLPPWCEDESKGSDGCIEEAKKVDCNPDDKDIYQGANETCDGKDNDCDGETDEDFTYEDRDGSSKKKGEKCMVVGDVKGVVACKDDKTGLYCKMADKCVNEICNGIDDDCDGETDEEGAEGCKMYYKDLDGDKYGNGLKEPRCLCNADHIGDYTALNGDDCNDADPSISPEGKEVCNYKDDDCDGETDEGKIECGKGECFHAVDLCKDGKPQQCDPMEGAGLEICDGKDNDCDGEVDEEGGDGCVLYYQDNDVDGYGGEEYKCLCKPLEPYTSEKTGDCNDNDPQISPGLTEICNDKKDNNCDGKIDEEGCEGCQEYYKDMDQDNYGVNGDKKCLGSPSFPYTAVTGGDCDDNDENIKPGAQEVCNGKDDNCDGQTDPQWVTGCLLFYPDNDKDGYGANLAPMCYCKPTGIYTAVVSGDCNDNDPQINPMEAEVCDGKDNNCNGQVDEGVLETFYQDSDGDGYGSTATQMACTAPQGYTDKPGDCNDFNKDINPGAKEVCNDVDDNCNGLVDDGLQTQKIYKDNDGDGWSASNAVSMDKCNVPTGWTTKNDPPDCDDTDVTTYPGAKEKCDGKDNNCNGQVDEGVTTVYFKDLDGDGYGVIVDSKSLCNPSPPYIATKSGDCDDGDKGFYPGMKRCNGNNVETCLDNGGVASTPCETFEECKDGKCVIPVTSTSAGSGHTCALKKDGSVWCWGGNWDGQLGDGTNIYKSTPVQVQGLESATMVSADYLHTCALKKDGSVWCWGNNEWGQLGDGTTVDKSTPVQVQGL